MDANDQLLCHRCAGVLTPGDGSFYVVRIEAVCDPTAPDLDRMDPPMDFAAEWERLLEQLRDMSEREMMDQVHRRMTIHLCAVCYQTWIENPAR